MQCGDVVVYGFHGVCRIAGVETRKVDFKEVSYYVLEPIFQNDSRFYVPVHNPAAMAKLRKVKTKEEMEALLQSGAAEKAYWIADENQRKEAYRQMITRADCAELIPMIGALYAHKQSQQAVGKKFHQCDENFLRDAQRLICWEVSYALGILPEAVEDYIRSRIEENPKTK